MVCGRGCGEGGNGSREQKKSAAVKGGVQARANHLPGEVALHFLCSLKENQAGNFILVAGISFDSAKTQWDSAAGALALLQTFLRRVHYGCGRDHPPAPAICPDRAFFHTLSKDSNRFLISTARRIIRRPFSSSNFHGT